MIKLLFAFACLIYVTTATTASSEQNRTEYYDTALKTSKLMHPGESRG